MRLDAAVRAAAWMNALFLSPQQRRGGLASVSAGRRAGAELSKRERYARFEPRVRAVATEPHTLQTLVGSYFVDGSRSATR
jgi:hypothetical protein